MFKITTNTQSSQSTDHFDQKIDLTGCVQPDSTMTTYDNHSLQSTDHLNHNNHHLHNNNHHHNQYFNHNNHYNHNQRKVSLTTDHSYIKCQSNESNQRQSSEDDSFGTSGNYFQSLDPLNLG